MDQLIGGVYKTFRETDESVPIQERREQLRKEFEYDLAPCEKEYFDEFTTQISDLDSLKEHFLYRQGIRDCIHLLKWLGVIT